MSDTPDESKKPDIIIDEGWKAQVEAEREAARHAEQTADEPNTDAEAAPAEETAEQEFGPMPPASLSFLVTTLATQAMVSMGLIPDPLSQKAQVRLDQAKHFIDMLQVIEEKTEGNRNDEESRLLDSLLHELRMGYVAVEQGQGGKPA